MRRIPLVHSVRDFIQFASQPHPISRRYLTTNIIIPWNSVWGISLESIGKKMSTTAMAIRREWSRRSASEGECGGTSYPKSYPTLPCSSTANSLNLLIESPRFPQRRRPNRAPPVYEGSRQTCPGTSIRDSSTTTDDEAANAAGGSAPGNRIGTAPNRSRFLSVILAARQFDCSETAFRGRPRI